MTERRQRTELQMRDPLGSLRRFQEEMLARRGGSPVAVEVEELLGDMREERDEEILRSFAGKAFPHPDSSLRSE